MTTATLNTQREQLREQFVAAVDQRDRDRAIAVRDQLAATFAKGQRVRALVNMGGGHRAYYETGTFLGASKYTDELCYFADATPDYVTRCDAQHVWSLDESR